MYQTLIQQAEIRQQEMAAWAAREQLARDATRGQKSLFARLVTHITTAFAQPRPHSTTPATAAKRRAQSA